MPKENFPKQTKEISAINPEMDQLAISLIPDFNALKNTPEQEKNKNFEKLVSNYKKLLNDFEENLIRLETKNTSVKSYTDELSKDFGSYEKTINKNELLDQITQKNLILFGDFHTLRRSQETFLNTVKEYYEHDKDIALGLEFLPPNSDKSIKNWFTNKIKDNDFFKKLQKEIKKISTITEKQMRGYKQILYFAKEKNINTRAIDTPRNQKNIKIDENLAKNILETKNANPLSKLFILIGEAHLSKTHLPEKIDKLNPQKTGIKILIIFQNLNDIFIKALENKDIFKADISLSKDWDFLNHYFKLKNNAYNINNVSSITKYLSFCEYLEKEDANEIIADLAIDLLNTLIKNLDSLNIKINAEEIKNKFPTLVFENEDEYKKSIKRLTDREKKYLEINDCYLLENKENMLIKEFKLTSATREIGKFIFQEISHQLPIDKTKIKELENTFMVLCSRFILPQKYGQKTFSMDEKSDKNADYIFNQIFNITK